MKRVAYLSPWIPPELIAAHGCTPYWLPPDLGTGNSLPLNRGFCPVAAAALEAATAGLDAAALILTTTCDQMRRAAGMAQERGRLPVFLLNVPATWQTATARQLYREELARLGRFLTSLGDRFSPERFAASCEAACQPARQQSDVHDVRPGAIRLALLGGPLLGADFTIFGLVARLGGAIVLDASENGRRRPQLPSGILRCAQDDLMAALADAYFDGIVDVFRRPNDRLYEWLGREVAACGVRGILLRRYVWCDLWHAELYRLKRWSPVPVLEIDVAGPEGDAAARTTNRLEAFLEMLRA
jgi:benzoyl-CoA reductase/2-hydroxyglutaryl-CoA dehydratase subunit BcrC/BadD/HgdB